MNSNSNNNNNYSHNNKLYPLAESEIVVPPTVPSTKDDEYASAHFVDSSPTTVVDLPVANPISEAVQDAASNNNGSQEEHEPSATSIQTHPLLVAMKRRRLRAQYINGTTGALLGLVVLGPVGALALGYLGNRLTKHSLKLRERVVQQELQRRGHVDVTVI